MAEEDKKQDDTLAAMLEELKKLNENSSKDKKDKEKENKGFRQNLLKSSEKHAKALLAAIPSVGSAIKGTIAVLGKSFNEAKELQKTALSRGLNFGDLTTKLEDANNNLAGNLIGTTGALQIEMEKVAVGMNKSTAATDKLAAFTKVTGGNSKKLLKGLEELNFGVGMSSDQQSSLSKTIMSLSQNFQMSTEELMGTIKGLEKNMPMLKILGIAPEISEATARLGAALGQEAGDMAADIVNSFATAQGAVLASQLGVTNERLAVLKKEGDVTQNTMKLVTNAGREASRMYKQFLDGGADPAVAFKAVEDALGPAVAKAAITFRQLEKKAGEMGMEVDEYTQLVAKQNKAETGDAADPDR